MERQKWNLEKMSNDSGIPIPVLKTLLGIPLEGVCNATTAKEAENLFAVCEAKTDLEVINFRKWVELAPSFEVAFDATKRAPNYLGLKLLAFKKAVELLTSSEEAFELYCEIGIIFLEEEEIFSAFSSLELTWLNLYIKDFKPATNFEEAFNNYKFAPCESIEEIDCFNVALGFVTNFKELEELENIKEISSDVDTENVILNQKYFLSLKKAKFASNFEEALEALNCSIEGSESEKISFQKCLQYLSKDLSQENKKGELFMILETRENLLKQFFVQNIEDYI